MTYEHPLYRFIFLCRGRFVYCPFLPVRFNCGKAFCLYMHSIGFCDNTATENKAIAVEDGALSRGGCTDRVWKAYGSGTVV